MVNGWKVTAIIFIIISLLELALLVGFVAIGLDVIEKEEHCSYEICNLDESMEYDAYLYDPQDGSCSCYQDSRVVYSKYIG
jgi:hypothetical protein